MNPLSRSHHEIYGNAPSPWIGNSTRLKEDAKTYYEVKELPDNWDDFDTDDWDMFYFSRE